MIVGSSEGTEGASEPRGVGYSKGEAIISKPKLNVKQKEVCQIVE